MSGRSKFEDRFWSDTNQGYEVLLHAMKSQITATKELMDYIKERAGVEDVHGRNLSKLHKQIHHVSEGTMGTYFPVWTVNTDMLGKLTEVSSKFVKTLLDLAKEVGEYNQCQKDKMKGNLAGEIETAKEAFHAQDVAKVTVQKMKKAYEQAHHEKTVVQNELTALQNLGTAAKPKDVDKADAKLKKAEAVLIHAKQEYTTAVENHVNMMMDYQGKHKEACAKFESIEEEYLAQMVTFTIQLASALEANVIAVDTVHKEIVRKISDLSVDKLLAFFMQTKGTGTDIPRPEKVRLIKEVSPSPSNVSAVSQSNVSTTSTSEAGQKVKERKFKIPGFKRGKQATVDTSTTSNGPTANVTDSEPPPEVDEEGFSIRPQDADRITGFSDFDNTHDSDSDLDDDDDVTTTKLKRIHIREKSDPVTTATVDDIKASLRGFQLSPVLPKAGSLNALNTLNVSERSPSTSRRAFLSPTEGDLESSVNKTMASSLFDLDVKSVNVSVGTPPGMPPPLIPTISDLFASTTTTTTTMTTDQLPGSTLPWVGTDTPESKKTSTPLATPASSAAQISTPPTVLSKPPSESSITPVSVQLKPPPSASPILPKPPPGKGRRMNKTTSGTNTSSSSPTLDTKQTEPITTTATTASSLQVNDGPPLPTKRRATMSADTLKKTDSSSVPDVSASLSFSTANTTDSETNMVRKPVPIPRRNTLDRGLTGSSPLVLSAMRSPDTSTSSLPSIDVKNGDDKTTTLQPQQPSLAPSSSNSSLSSIGGNLSRRESAGGAMVVPIALAIQETVNASFTGKKGITKVTGQVDMSFATSYIPHLNSHDPLVFKLSNVDNVERLEHNRNLVGMEEDKNYKFNMNALHSFLNEQISKSPGPAKFYNVQVFRYEVMLPNGVDDLPLRLQCFWKCDPTTTNYRLDYKYNPSAVKNTAMTGLTIGVTLDGTVSRHLSKPEGKWAQDQQKLLWQLPQVVAQPQSLQAKFELSSGPSHPSPTLVQFTCDGGNMSGMQLDLIGQAYKISFKKTKLSTGKYVAMPAE
ncbi:F-BAR domain only protein 2-like isoform X2 [Dysidea avara]|uniref:F-BAR domain only protein 2-like isoform X2 n=1 Tax=Dysidea avara TaxID=196820 RepID=UPI00332DC9C2